jgi:type IV pilus assembly protein PilF
LRSFIFVHKRVFYLLIISFLPCFIFFLSCASTLPSREKRAQINEDMGRSLVQEGKSREALLYLLEAEKLNSSDPELQHQLALAYQKLGEYSLSHKHFQKAISLKSKFPEAYNNWGILYSQQKEWDKALDCFEKATTDILYSTPHFAYHNMGTVYLQKGDFFKAIEYYEKAIKLAPGYIVAYQDLANLYESKNQNEKALSIYKKAISIEPQYSDIHLSLSRLLFKIGQKEEAIKLLNNIISTDPRSRYAKDATKLLESIRHQ